jgi:putative flippase GtrA
LGVRIGIMHLLMEYLGMGKGHWYILASIVGIAGGTVTNFFGSKYIAFSKNMR